VRLTVVFSGAALGALSLLTVAAHAQSARRASDRLRRRARYERTLDATTDRRGAPLSLPRAAQPVPFSEAPAPRTNAARPYDHVVLLSIDGLRPDAIALSDAPNLERLSQRGLSATEARTITLSYTLPSHASMLAGVDAPTHGLVHNDFTPRHGFSRAPTALYFAHDAGLATAMFVSKPKFRHLAIPGSVDVFERPSYQCPAVARRAASYIANVGAGLTFVHLSEPDSAGHDRGWMTVAYLRAIAAADVCLGALLTAIEARRDRDRFLLIVTSDHGGHGRTHGSTREVDRRIPWIAWGSAVRPGPHTEPVSVMDSAATALAALGLPLPPELEGRPVRAALSRATSGARAAP
jgi:arylsulfatase A-like enzyme